MDVFFITTPPVFRTERLASTIGKPLHSVFFTGYYKQEILPDCCIKIASRQLLRITPDYFLGITSRITERVFSIPCS